MIQFVTSNKNKFAEAKHIIPELVQLELDLPEIQELDLKKIIEYKIPKDRGAVVVEDVSLEIKNLNGLPGPLVKWFEKALGAKRIYELAPDSPVRAVVIVAYRDEAGELHFFEGIAEGTIVAPRGDNGFGFDPIFQPIGSSNTFAEMTTDEKNAISHRAIAFRKLADFLTTER